MGLGRIAHMQQVQFGVALQGQGMGAADHPVVQMLACAVAVEVHRRRNLPQQRQADVADQMHGDRAFLEQLPVQRRDQQALEHGLVLHVLDQQVATQPFDAFEHAAQRVAGQQQLGGDIEPGVAQLLSLVGEPLAVVGEQALTLVAVAHQAKGVDIVDEYIDIQQGTTGLGQRRRALQRRGMAHLRAEHDEQTLELAHRTPPRVAAPRFMPCHLVCTV